MIDVVGWKNCTLCRACEDACPKDAIRFHEEHCGFFYPTIQTERCIRCERCAASCPALSESVTVSEGFPLAFGAKSKDPVCRREATSGGIFWEAANYVLSQGGYVSGAVFDDKWHVKHIVSNKAEDVLKMRGSKYAQSMLSGVYREIQKRLNEGAPVLFCGCPCQIAALRTYLKNVPDHLYLIELVCHGIPSDQMLQSYIAMMEKRYGSRLTELKFRDKTFGWHRSAVRMQFENGKVYSKPITCDAYMNGFLRGSTLKEACYTCRYKAGSTGCDLLLGDFWGAEKELPGFDDNTGLSGVLVYTDKGRRLMRSLDVDSRQIAPDAIIHNNKNITESTARNPLRETFFSFAESSGTEKAIKKYFEETKTAEFKRELRYKLRCIYYRLRGKERPLY